MKVVISSGHGLYVRGASCDKSWGLDEVDSARQIVPVIAKFLRARDVEVMEFHDNTSHNVEDNLATIVDAHNYAFDGDGHTLDVSVHLNA